MHRQQLLNHTKFVAVRGVHKEVHRQRFHELKQSESESITHFLARVKSHASLCDFQVTCTREGCSVGASYAEDMISSQLMSGLSNIEYQSKVLAEVATLRPLKRRI